MKTELGEFICGCCGAFYVTDTHCCHEAQVSGPLSIRSTSQDGLVTFSAWLNGKPVGTMKISVMPLVHDLAIDEGMLQRKVADALFQYASGYVRAKGFGEAAVLVASDNDKMRRYVEQRAIPEDPASMYLMEVK